MAPFVHQVEHITNVHSYATCQSGIEVNVAGEAVPVAVECQSNEPSLSVEHRRAAVSARDVVVG